MWGSVSRSMSALRLGAILTAELVGRALRPESAAETAVGAVVAAYRYPRGDVRRYGAVADNATDCTAAINTALAVAKHASGDESVVRLPKGKLRITAPLNLTGCFFANNLRVQGEGPFASQIVAAFNGGTVLDLSGSVMVTLSQFGVIPAAGFKTNQVLLCARLASNASSGLHVFDRVYLEGDCNNAVAVLWGSEENQFYSSWITCGNGGAARNFPALVAAVNMPIAGFTPTSSFVTLGTGSGGVGMNTFVGCRIANESGIVQSVPLVRLHGTLGAHFVNCFTACWPGANGATFEIGGSLYPDDPLSVYPATVTFDGCSDENPWGDQATQRTIQFAATHVTGAVNVRGVSISNCQFFRIYGEDGSIVDGLHYQGGKFSNSVPAPTGTKGSFYNLKNARIDVAQHEAALGWTVRNIGEGNAYSGINAGLVALGVDTTSTIVDAAGGALVSGVLARGTSVGVGYGAGAGGAVTQTGSVTTGVTLNTPTGRITTVALTLAAGALAEFTLTNSRLTATDVVKFSTTYTGAGSPFVYARAMANGSCVVCIKNMHASAALNAAAVINFAVIRAINV